jgi:hypothetical protein
MTICASFQVLANNHFFVISFSGTFKTSQLPIQKFSHISSIPFLLSFAGLILWHV